MVLSSRGELMKNALVYAYIGDSLYECYIRKYLISKGINPKYIFQDIASGMNEKRKGLNELL